MLLLKQIKERYKLSIYNLKDNIVIPLRIINIIISSVALFSIIYYYGYPKTPETREIISLIIKSSLFFYVLKYCIKLSLNFSPLNFIKDNLFEGIILLIVIINWIVYYLLNIQILELIFSYFGFKNVTAYIDIFIQIYFFLIFALESGKASTKLSSLNINPSALLSFSFVFLISSGAALLMLPEMTTNGISLVDAYFTSTSACCVTGLSTVSTATFFTFKGKFIIMILIKLGGLNMLSFATFFATLHSAHTGLKYQSLIKDFFNSDYLSDTRKILYNILFYSIFIETVGTILIYISWNENIHFNGFSDKLFFSMFHSVSAFNNAGFSLFGNGLAENYVNLSFSTHFIIAILIILGGIGFFTLQDIFSFEKIRERRQKKWKKIQVNTRIILYSTLLLIVAGTVVIFIIENNKLLSGMTFIEKLSHSFFQSVTTRTAGFNTIDIGALSLPILLFMMMLMFIGASPGSTGGGIKTTTFFIIFKSVIATIKGHKQVVAYKSTISFNSINKAYSVVIFSITLIFTSTFLLSITETNMSFTQLLFEEISAFATVGLSTGITANLSEAGKVIIILSMFIGRIGPLTLALSLSKKADYTDYKYAKANIMIG
ncbi:MAG: hypothetical protein A2046_00780 [Bacteroidetes bacterium GWA2_30_7]|nr:MAG: hypothetical protein A2046_00780 [Bacteroidetes bacterium GWA2_30_7]